MENPIVPDSQWLLTSPPIVIAILAMAAVLLWQTTGASILALIYRRFLGLPALWSACFAWLTWLPLTGVIILWATLLGIASRGLFLSLGGASVMTGILVMYKVRGSLYEYGRRSRPLRFSRWLWVALLIKTIEMTYAAHPQRLYDQLNYHLVVAKKTILHGSPFPDTFDTHVLFSGPVEFAFALGYALIPNDLFLIAFGQAWVFIAVIFAIYLAWLAFMQSADSPFKDADQGWIWLLLAVAYPALIPDAEMARIAKPDGLLLAATSVLLLAAGDRRLPWLPICFGFGALFVSCKLTFVHAGLGFGFVLIGFAISGQKRLGQGSLRIWVGAVLLGALALATFCGKNLLVGGSPLYPADARFWPSALADEQTIAYWQDIAFRGSEGFAERMLGGAKVLWRQPLLVAWLVLLATVAVWKKKSWSSPQLQVLRPAGLFLVGYLLSWPLFYDSQIYTRFVAPYPAGILVLAFLTLSQLPQGQRRWVAICGTLLALAGLHIEVKLNAIWHDNQGNAESAFAEQHPRFLTAQSVNRRLPKESLVLLDDPAQLTFDMHTLYSELSPRERLAWHYIVKSPREAAAKLRIGALVRRQSGPKPPWPAGPLDSSWEGLVSHGRVERIGADEVLLSECFFQALPCPPDSDKN